MKPGLPPIGSHSVTRLHAIGVTGMGLGPLACYLAQRGFAVTGEDDHAAVIWRRHLRASGVELRQSGRLPSDAELVICSSAINPDHPTVVAADAAGIPVMRRGEVLAAVAREKKLVAVCGSHGKTTTTALLASALAGAGASVDFVIGGLPASLQGSPAHCGNGEWLVAEVDESDGTIEKFAPEVMVLVNHDWDHPDHYASADALRQTFARLAERTRSVVVRPVSVGPLSDTREVTVGEGGDYAATCIGQTLTLGGAFPKIAVKLPLAGAFNAENGTFALTAASVLGAVLAPGLWANFPGLHRRQEFLLRTPGLTVVEDYAHHPAEVKALLQSLREQAGAARLMVAFQPHRYSRTRQFAREFAEALKGADAVYLMDVYSAGEEPLADGTSAEIAKHLADYPALTLTANWPAELTDHLLPGDWLAIVGAGNIGEQARAWVARRAWTGHLDAMRAVVSADTFIGGEIDLAVRTTMRVGGAARIMAEPATEADLGALVRVAKARGVPVILLGRGSNLIVPDEGVDALVVNLKGETWERFDVQADGRVAVGAGLRLKRLCGLAAKAGLPGFEFLEGIPGNVGGALRMNAGAMGGWIFDIVESVRVMDDAGDVREWDREQLHVGYRHCRELHAAIALGAVLRPTAKSEADTIARQMDTYRDKRQKSQPREPSAGCIFKNPEGDSAGRLIDASGLKGLRVGDAEVSTVHANFIVNRGTATAAEVITLVREVRRRVAAAQGVELEPEVLLYGLEWGDVL